MAAELEVRASSRWRWHQFRLTIARSDWVIPACYVVVSIVMAVLLVRWDDVSPIHTSLDMNAENAATALSALGSGMIAFTGFSTAVVLLVVQFGSSQFSPRYLRWFRNDRTLKHAIGTFIATFLFALVATAMTGRGANSVVPSRALLFALVLTVASVGWFLALISRTANNLRVAHVTQHVDHQARDVFDAVYPASHSDVQAASETTATLRDATPLQVVRHGGVGAVLVSIDRAALARHADANDSVVELVAAVGDHVASNAVVLRVYGERTIRERALRAGLLFGDERTIEDDPAFAIRLLVDVAIKALSPAVNDPTTAVQSIDRIEDVLRYASAKHLSAGVVTDGDGQVRLIYPTPSWDDLVSLSLDEIRSFGAGQYQIARRLRALLTDLIRDVPEERRPALAAQLELLGDAVALQIPTSQRSDALVADRQGLGLSLPDQAT